MIKGEEMIPEIIKERIGIKNVRKSDVTVAKMTNKNTDHTTILMIGEKIYPLEIDPQIPASI